MGTPLRPSARGCLRERVKAGAVAIEFIDHEGAGMTELFGHGPHFFGVRLDAVNGIDNYEGGVSGGEGGAGVVDE